MRPLLPPSVFFHTNEKPLKEDLLLDGFAEAADGGAHGDGGGGVEGVGPARLGLAAAAALLEVGGTSWNA